MDQQSAVVYHLVVEDIQTVALDCLDREISQTELEIVKSRIAEYIPWYDAIWECMISELHRTNTELPPVQIE